MMREGGQNLEERVRRLEADFEGHERELERLRLSLAPPRDVALPDWAGVGPEAGVGVSRDETVAVSGARAVRRPGEESAPG